jgi:hypothetical protein
MTVSTTYTLRTSADPATPSNHLFLMPVLNVKYSETADIQFNVSTCSTSRDDVTTWALESQDNTNLFSVTTYWDIEQTEVRNATVLSTDLSHTFLCSYLRCKPYLLKLLQ